MFHVVCQVLRHLSPAAQKNRIPSWILENRKGKLHYSEVRKSNKKSYCLNTFVINFFDSLKSVLSFSAVIWVCSVLLSSPWALYHTLKPVFTCRTLQRCQVKSFSPWRKYRGGDNGYVVFKGNTQVSAGKQGGDGGRYSALPHPFLNSRLLHICI
jgi:hypothetical protein